LYRWVCGDSLEDARREGGNPAFDLDKFLRPVVIPALKRAGMLPTS